MNNLRFKIGIKEIVYVVLLFVIIRMIPPEASDLGALVLTVGAVVGAVPYLFILIATMLAFCCPTEIWLKFFYAKHELAKIEKICSDCEIARVEYLDAGHHERRWYIRGSSENY